jgi:hypothetical protein
MYIIHICIYLFLYFYVMILLVKASVMRWKSLSEAQEVCYQFQLARISQDVINSLGQLHFLEDINKCKP